MKKLFAILTTVLTAAVLLAGCAGNTAGSSEGMPTVLSTTEYSLYQNIFYNDMAADYTDKQVTKEGTFTTLYDAFYDTTRYYVWGYNDETKCCDWQWELDITDTSSLPANGSLVSVTGTFTGDENALDKYWIIEPVITVKTKYKGEDCDIDMSTMSGTLERVEILNIQYNPTYFDGKTVVAYGRVGGPTSIVHPYYDGAFEVEVIAEEALPDFGTMVLVQGVAENGSIIQATAATTDAY